MTEPETKPISCSFFRTAMDNHPTPWVGTWGALAKSFGWDRTPTTLPTNHDPKKGLPGICSATFEPGKTRACAHVVSLQLLILDVDNAEEHLTGEFHPSGRPVIGKRATGAPALLGPICDELARLQIAAYAWSTWSSTPDWPRFRLVIPLSVAVPPDVWGQLGEWVIDVSGLARWRSCLDLPVLRDTARLNFLPAQRHGGPSVERRQVIARILIPPPVEALRRVPPPVPTMAPWQKDALERRQASGACTPGGSGGKHSWAKRFKDAQGRLLDLRELEAVRMLEAIGCRVGSARAMAGATKYRTTCPWPAEHSQGVDDDSAVLIMEPGKWPSWKCLHSHHAHLGLFDLMEAAGVLR